MPKSPILEIPPEEQARMLAALRRARYGYLLALHSLPLCAVRHNPTVIAAVLFGSRSSVYRPVRAYRESTLDWEHDAQGRLVPPVRTPVLLPTLRRSLLALLKAPPRAYGRCRTRWRCATLALTLQAGRGRTVSAETMRRWLHEMGGVWKRATLVAKDDDPPRVNRLARSRFVFEQLKLHEAMIVADERDSHLLPKVGCAWMPKGTPMEVMTPGQNAKPYLAGALDLTTGTRHHCPGARKTNALCRDLLSRLEDRSPAEQYTRLYVGVDNDKVHKAKAVEHWWDTHPPVPRRFLPTYCPRANPIERACGDVHDGCTRNHQRKRLPDLVVDVEDHLRLNGPWKYARSDRYYEPAVTAAVETIAVEEHVKVAA